MAEKVHPDCGIPLVDNPLGKRQPVKSDPAHLSKKREILKLQNVTASDGPAVGCQKKLLIKLFIVIY